MGNFFVAIGTAIYNFITNPVVQAVMFVAQGVTAHQAAMKAKRTGADILLQKYGTGGGIPVIYGTRRVAGTVVYMETQNNRELYVVYAIAAHEIDSFDLESIQLDGRTIKDTNIYRQGYDISDGTTRINFRPSSVTRASGTFWGNTSTERANITGGANINNKARMTFNCHKGTTSQAADPMLEGILTDWTSNHKLTGIAYIAANYEYDTQGMFSGIPNLTIVVNGKKVFDPRDTGQTFGTESTYTHSSNAALCLLDYITNDDYGKGLGTSDLESDFASWKTAADDCDTSVDTIDHTGISVESASTESDVMIIASASQAKFNKLKVGNKYTVDDGTTTYVNNKKLIDKDSTQIDLDGSNPFAILKLKFEDGAIDNAITSATSCDFAETQIRFDCNGVLDTEETVLENTKLLIANMRGIFTYANGKYQIKVEGAESSVVTLDEDDILESGITLSLENKEGKYNKVEAEFYNAQKRYESDTTYYTGETSDTFLADDGNEVLETRIQLPFCTNQRIAYNHAKGLLKRSRKQKTISFVATPKVLKAKVGEVITVSNTNLNLSSELYRITNMTINPDLNIAVTAIEYQTDVYGYVTPPDEDIDIPDDPPEGNRVVAPTNLTFTNKNATTGEAAKLTWTDSTKYPSYEFRVRIIDGLKTRYDKRVKDTYFYLDGISVKNGYEARVSAINALGVESDSTNITVNVTTEPITTPDIKQGSIGGFSFTDSKMYHPVDGSDTGVFETSNVYIDDAGQFSLKDKLSWNGSTLDISGNLTVENTITADKIVLDGVNLDDLFAASGSAGNSSMISSNKIFQFNWDVTVPTTTTYYGLRVDLTQLVPRVGIGVLTTPDDALHIKSGAPYVRLEDTGGYTRVKGVDTNIELEAGNTGSGYDNTSYILMDIAGNDVAKFHALGGMELPSLVPTTTTNRLYNNAGTLYWNGSAVGGGGSTTTINNNADNRVITGSGTANTLNGEANLTFDGSALGVTGAINGTGLLTLTNASNSHLRLAYTSSFYWDIYRENVLGDLIFSSSNVGGTFVKFDATDKSISAVGGYEVNGTTVIDSSRNLTNIGTISSGGITATDTYGGGSGDFTNVTTPQIKIVAEGGTYWRIPHLSGNSTISGVYNYQSGKDVYWGEPSDTGLYRFRGRDLRIENGGLDIGSTTVINSSRNLININNIFANNGEFTGSFLYTSGDLRIGTATGAINQTGIIKHNGTTYGLGLFNWGDANPIFIGGSEVNFRTESGSAIALKSNGTTFLDTSRNLTNIGTISSGAHTINTATNGLIFPSSHSEDKIRLYNGGSEKIGTASGVLVLTGNSINFKKVGGAPDLQHNGTVFLNSSRELTNIANINSGQITSTGGGSASSPTLALNSSTSSTFNHAINAFNSNLTAGENNVIIVGKAGSTKNSGYIGYKWNGAGGNNNLVTFGHWGSDNLMNLTGDGKLGIGTQSPDGLLHVSAGNSGDAIVIIQADEDNNAEGDVPQLWFKADGDITEGAVKLDDNELQLVSNVSAGGGITFWTGTTNNTGTTAPQTGATQKFKITTGGDFQVGSTTVISASRNLTNIGTYSGTDKLTLTNASNNHLRLAYNSSFYWDIYRESTTGDLIFDSSNTSGEFVRFDAIDKSITVAGNITAYSDERLKDNIETLDGSKVFAMRGVSFTKDNKAGSGVIAQEIEKIAPELVDTADDDMGTKSVAYGNLVGYLIEAVKELKAEIEELKK